MAEPERGAALTGFAGRGLLLVAGTLVGAVGWSLLSLLYAWAFEDGLAQLAVPFGVVTIFAAILVRERQLRALACGIVLGESSAVLFLLWILETTGS